MPLFADHPIYHVHAGPLRYVLSVMSECVFCVFGCIAWFYGDLLSKLYSYCLALLMHTPMRLCNYRGTNDFVCIADLSEIKV